MNFRLYLICIILGISSLKAQSSIEKDLISTPKYAVKFATRILSPRINFEKFTPTNNSFGFDLKLYTYWLPTGFRIEPYFRHYFRKAPFNAYFQPKVGMGVYSYYFVNEDFIGITAGAGLLFGGQYPIGINNAVIDVFGGFQLMPPIAINNGHSNSIPLQTQKSVHYILYACPIEVGFRIGFIKKKKTIIFNNENGNIQEY